MKNFIDRTINRLTIKAQFLQFYYLKRSFLKQILFLSANNLVAKKPFTKSLYFGKKFFTTI